MENGRIRIVHERQKEQILAEVRTEIQKDELQADGQGNEVPKAGRQQAAADSARQLPKRNKLIKTVHMEKISKMFQEQFEKNEAKTRQIQGSIGKSSLQYRVQCRKKTRRETEAGRVA